MFYFSHPFGISTPSSANNGSNIGEKKKPRKGSKYTTTTYLVTEIQKNHSDGSQDECEVKKNTHEYSERELLPWPRNFLLPPLLQLIEKKHGKLVFINFYDTLYLVARYNTKMSQRMKKNKRKQRRNFYYSFYFYISPVANRMKSETSREKKEKNFLKKVPFFRISQQLTSRIRFYHIVLSLSIRKKLFAIFEQQKVKSVFFGIDANIINYVCIH